MSVRTVLISTMIATSALVAARAAEVTTSARSRGVVDRVGPTLQAELQEVDLALGAPIFIRIFKDPGDLEVWVKSAERFLLFRTYPICFYSGALGPKLRQGDGQSPEGFYFVTPERLNPWSQFHLSINLGFPNAYDRFHGRTGSHLMVHGGCVSIGCYAMTDAGIEEIYTMAEAALRNGQRFFRVHVFPFRMTEESMDDHRSSRWVRYWTNLKEGYDWFELHRTPPDVNVDQGRYVFSNM